MQLHTIEMDRAEARARYLEYRDAVRERHDAELAEIMRGYRALARGHQVIDLAATIRAGGTVTKTVPHFRGGAREVTLPALAVMRADQPWCHVQVTRDGAVAYHHQGSPRSNETRNLIRLPVGTLDEDITTDYPWRQRAMVPPVPPRLRPKASLGNYHVLWEAEWERCAPVDPALLRHIGGDLYAVLATWDLTPLERTVLTRRFR